MAKVSVYKAAKEGYASRPTIYRAIKAGKLSAEKTDDGKTLVDTAELRRRFGEPAKGGQGVKAKGETVSAAGVSQSVKDDAARQEADLLRDTVRRLQDDLDRERADKERERSEKDRILALLEATQRQLTYDRTSWLDRTVSAFKRVTGSDKDSS